jgi:hypothetical protein
MVAAALWSKVVMISQRFTVEFDRRTVGIAVRVPGGFMFYASDSRFDELDGRLFPRARAIEAQLKKVGRSGARKTRDFRAGHSAA